MRGWRVVGERSAGRARSTWALGAALLSFVFVVGASPAAAQPPAKLDPLTLTKYVDPLPIPGAMPQAAANYYEIGMYQVVQQLHSDLPPTTVWGYGTSAATASYPAATIEATRGVPIQVRWTNNLPMTHLLDYAIDHTLHMAMPEAGVPAVAHLHGGEVEPGSDGGPDAWFTQGFDEKGPGWQYEVFTYPNQQLPATLWYHDHALGITRLNVYAGLAGYYLLRDPAIEAPLQLPSGAYEIPLVIQDRMFYDDGQLLYPTGGDNPEIHPLWQPEFFGDVILVNGKVWPHLKVEARKYRFRVLNGSNSRFYSLWLAERRSGDDDDDDDGRQSPAIWQIGSDGGYLDAPVQLKAGPGLGSRGFVLGPGERADIVIDFRGLVDKTFTLRNDARSPFPDGDRVDRRTTGQIMQFRVVQRKGMDRSAIATPGPGYVTRLSGATNTRYLTLDEMMGPNGPIEALLNNTAWDDPATELPEVGSTEVWEIINTTGDAHPIHLHLVQFQLVNRQRVDLVRFGRALDPDGGTPDPTPYLMGQPRPPGAEEAGWKDTFKMLPGEVTRVIVRFRPQDGSPAYSFDATAEPGYVWHCHILEHEDNEMMRPYRLQAPALAAGMRAGAGETSLAAEDVSEAITELALEQNAPNPAFQTTMIRFALPSAGPVHLRVYDVRGRAVRTLAAGVYPAGRHTVAWDGRDAGGAKLPGGVYLYRMEAGGKFLTRRATLLP